MLPKRLERTPIYESSWINLYVDKVKMPSGQIIEKYHQLDYPHESVVVLLLNAQKDICFIKSLRYTTQRIEWELPAGGMETGEDIITAASREVLEETGYIATKLKHFLTYNPSNGMSNLKVHVVFGEVAERETVDFDKNEVMEVHWISETDVKRMVANNEIMDGVSLLPLLMYLCRTTQTNNRI